MNIKRSAKRMFETVYRTFLSIQQNVNFMFLLIFDVVIIIKCVWCDVPLGHYVKGAKLTDRCYDTQLKIHFYVQT